MKNNELFFSCLLVGASEIVGIDNPINFMNEEEVQKYYKKVLKDLVNKKIISNQNNQILITEDYIPIITTIAFPDIAFSYSDENENEKNIYINGSNYVITLKSGEEIQIQLYKRDEFLDFLYKEFMLKKCSKELNFEIESSTFELLVNKQLSVEESESDTDEEEMEPDLKNVIAEFVSNSNSIEFIAYRLNQETPSEAILKMVKTENGTLVFMYINGLVKVFRNEPEDILNQILFF